MLEWMTLVLLVPVVIVPIVLLFGFAGCQLVFQAEPGAIDNVSIFDITLDDEKQRTNCCLIVRIEPERLGDTPGTLMRITVARPVGGDLNLRSMFVSHAADSGDPYDSATTPVLVVEDQLVSPSPDPNAQFLAFDPIAFAFQPAKPLLISMNIGSSGFIRRAANVPPSEGRAFLANGLGPEAEIADRSTNDVVPPTPPPYDEESSIYLIVKIEV